MVEARKTDTHLLPRSFTPPSLPHFTQEFQPSQSILYYYLLHPAVVVVPQTSIQHPKSWGNGGGAATKRFFPLSLSSSFTRRGTVELRYAHMDDL